MKSTFALFIALFTLTVLGNPVAPRITLSLINDITGLNDTATVVADGSFNTIQNMFENSKLDSDGEIIATSAQLDTPIPDVSCAFHYLDARIPINSTITFVDQKDFNDITAVSLSNANYLFQCQTSDTEYTGLQKRQSRIQVKGCRYNPFHGGRGPYYHCK